MSVPGWLSIVLSLAAIAISLNAIRINRKTRQIIDETNRALAAKWARDCVTHGDLTPAGERSLLRILGTKEDQ